MSALFDELEKQARLLTPQEKATLARILIEELDPSSDTEVEQIWIAEAQRVSGVSQGRDRVFSWRCGHVSSAQPPQMIGYRFLAPAEDEMIEAPTDRSRTAETIHNQSMQH